MRLIICSFLLSLVFPIVTFAQSAPVISQVSAPPSVSRFGKYEATFQVATVATNTFFPFDASPPPGLPAGTGITVTGHFTSPDGQVFTQPGFYYQQFDQAIKSGDDWLYPTANYTWKVRFAPHVIGNWSLRITAEDAGGHSQSSQLNFAVSESINLGFVRVSPQDARYFEHDTGKYFPGLGFNLNAGNLDFTNPTSGNNSEFNSMQVNGLQLSRVWISQKSIYGAAWGHWLSPNPAHITNEPVIGLSHPADSKHAGYGITSPQNASGSNFYLWLNFDKTQSGNGQMFQFTPCRQIGWNGGDIPVKRTTNYRVRVRYQTKGVMTPADNTKPYGFVIKEGGWLWHNSNESQRCYQPGTGSVMAGTYPGANWSTAPDPSNPGWSIMTGIYNSGNKDFFDNVYLSLENLVWPGANQSGGHAFVDHVWIEEDLGGGQYGPNIIYKPSMTMNYYVNQRDALAFDIVLAEAESKGIYLKPVMLDKNDWSFVYINPDGSLSPNRLSSNFYGNPLTGNTKVHWLHQAWWRYMQGRWGYSPNIHSWELLNEGPPDNNEGHWDKTDVFGNYMKCGVFGQNTGNTCTYQHPNRHMVSTSFYSQSFAYHLWNNTSGNYSNVDFADQHDYVTESEDLFYDAAKFAYDYGVLRGAYKQPNDTYNPSSVKKPIIRGEIGWNFASTDLFDQNASNGLWLHNLVWAGINHGGAIEQYWVGGSYQDHVYNIAGNGTVLHDHRSKFGDYYQFIKDIPLNNGQYRDASASASLNTLRAWGQKDLVNNRAHLWISNTRHTWCAVATQSIPGCLQAKWSTLTNAQKRLSGTVTLAGFTPNTSYPIEWWQFDENSQLTTPSPSSVTSNSSGTITLNLDQLPSNVVDAGVKIGNYETTIPTISQIILAWLTNMLDQNGDGKVNSIDFAILLP